MAVKRIVRQRLEISQQVTVRLRKDASLLSVQGAGGSDFGVWLWVAQGMEGPEEDRVFSVLRSGDGVDVSKMTHVGMAVLGDMVFHVFEARS